MLNVLKTGYKKGLLSIFSSSNEQPMVSEKNIELFRQLVYHWEEVEGLACTLGFSHYLMAFEELQAITNHIDRTKAIVDGVMRQSSQLGRSPEWILNELKFEAQAERTGDRREWLRTELAAGQASDEALDLYNERSGRFTSTT